MRPRILVVGSFAMDLIVSTNRFPNSGETVIGCGFQTAPGGKGANQAVQAARLGAQVTMVGKVGNDSYGKALLEIAQESGVEVSKTTVIDGVPTGIANVQIEIKDGKSANRIIVVPGANMKLEPQDIMFLYDTIEQYDMVMLQLEIPIQINEIVARIAYGKGVPVMLNPAPAAPLSHEFLKCITYISPNEHEAHDLTGIAVTDDESAKRAVEKLNRSGVENAIITLGANGAVFGNKDSFIKSPAVEGLEIVDTTAAGDSFIAAFCTATCLGAEPEMALEFANTAAAITISRMGAQPSLPDINEVLSLMKQRRKNIDMFEILR